MSSTAAVATVLLTGASKGIGRAIAIKLAESNKYKLALLSRNLSSLKETENLCKNINNNVKTYLLKCDVTNSFELKKCIEKCENEFGPLCILINNAGILYKHMIDDNIDFNKIQESYDINVKAVIISCAYSLPFIKKNTSKYPNLTFAVINIGSIVSTLRGSSTKMGIYMSTKFAVRGFTTSLFKEVRDYGIKTSLIMPGFVNTEMVNEITHPGASNKDIRNKMIPANDVANAVNFVLNSSSKCCPLEMLLYPQDDVMKYLVGTNSKL